VRDIIKWPAARQRLGPPTCLTFQPILVVNMTPVIHEKYAGLYEMKFLKEKNASQPRAIKQQRQIKNSTRRSGCGI